MPDFHNTHRTLSTCSLFLHMGYIGAVTVAAGLIQLSAGEASWPSALGLVLFGGILATASWRRAQTVAELADRRSNHLERALARVTPRGIGGTDRPIEAGGAALEARRRRFKLEESRELWSIPG
jgi:hypothetical protein